jgi:hypothetical protein
MYVYKVYAIPPSEEKLKESEYLNNLGADGRIILKLTLKKQGLLTRCFADGNEALDSAEGENILEQLNVY